MTHLQAMAQRHRYIVQVCFVALATTACELIADRLAFRSPLNLAWMVGLPIGVGLAANPDGGRRSFMAMALLGVSLAVGMIVGVNFTSYG